MKINSKTCLIYSPGGHYTELKKSLKGIYFKNKYHVTFKSGTIDNNKVYYITHPQKKIIRTMINLLDSLKVLIKEKPKIIISTGADVALNTIILGKLFFNSKIIFIESSANITKPSLTGRISYYFSDLFIAQWQQMRKFYPKAKISKGFLH